MGISARNDADLVLDHWHVRHRSVVLSVERLRAYPKRGLTLWRRVAGEGQTPFGIGSKLSAASSECGIESVWSALEDFISAKSCFHLAVRCVTLFRLGAGPAAMVARFVIAWRTGILFFGDYFFREIARGHGTTIDVFATDFFATDFFAIDIFCDRLGTANFSNSIP